MHNVVALGLFFLALLPQFYALPPQTTRGLLDGYLEDFDLECLRQMMQDENARQALADLSALELQNPDLDPNSLVDLEALELQSHLSCVSYTSQQCGDVIAAPSPDQISPAVDAIVAEIQGMSDDEILRAVNFDIDGLCASLASIDAALEPYQDCIERNLNAFANLPAQIQRLIANYLRGESGSPEENPWNFDLEEAANLTTACVNFKANLADSARDQLSAEFWTKFYTNFVSLYDGQSFDEAVSNDITAGTPENFGCTIPTELICTKQKSVFFSTCELIGEQNFDFTLQAPIDGSEEAGSAYFNAFKKYSEENPGTYPCADTFDDYCYGQYLSDIPEIPDLGFQSICKSSSYFYGLTGETPPTASIPPTQEPTHLPTPTPTQAPTPTQVSTQAPTQGPNPTQPTESPATPTATNAPTNDGTSGDMGKNPGPISAGGVIAIVLGVLIGVGIIIGAAIWYKRKITQPIAYQLQLE